ARQLWRLARRSNAEVLRRKENYLLRDGTRWDPFQKHWDEIRRLYSSAPSRAAKTLRSESQQGLYAPVPGVGHPLAFVWRCRRFVAPSCLGFGGRPRRGPCLLNCAAAERGIL